MDEKKFDKTISIEVHDNDASPEVRAYFFALGQFVTYFTIIEKAIYVTSCIAARVPFPIGRAAFGGSARSSESIERTKRILSVSMEIEPNGIVTTDIVKKFTYVFDQFAIINKARNLILHNGPELGPGTEWRVSNWHLAYTEKKVIEMVIQTTDLTNMMQDLQKMLAILSTLNAYLAGDAQIEQVLGAPYQRLIGQPWLHKSNIQAGVEPKTSHKPQKKTSHKLQKSTSQPPP